MVLTDCDMTTGPAGAVVTFEERLAAVEHRYGANHVVARSVRQAQAEVERCIAFVEGRLREVEADQRTSNRLLLPPWVGRDALPAPEALPSIPPPGDATAPSPS